MQTEKPYFSKDMTQYLKGIMLILMFILHLFCFPSWYVDGISYPRLSFMENMQGHFQICIAGFAFLTGYFYSFAKNKNYRYSFNKILDTMIPYWVVFAAYLLIGIITKTYNGGAITTLLEIISLSNIVIGFAWYVPFYVLAMLTLPLLYKLFHNKLWLFALGGILGPIALYYVVSYLAADVIPMGLIEKYQVYFPIMTIGYVAAERNLFSKIDSVLEKIPGIARFFVYAALIVIVFFEPGWLYAIPIDNTGFLVFRKIFRIISIPFFMYGLIKILEKIDNVSHNLLIPLKTIGKYSLLMWFVHSLFFSCSKTIFQKILYFPKNPLLVLIWGLIISLCISYLFDLLVQKIKKLIKSTS